MSYRVRIRRFLNAVGYNAGAYVFAAVEDSSTYSNDEFGPFADIDLRLADCDRIVRFDFDLSTRGARRNSLRKIDLMIDALERFLWVNGSDAGGMTEMEGQRAHCTSSRSSTRLFASIFLRRSMGDDG